MNDPDTFMFFEEPSLDAIEVPVLEVFDGDGFLTKIAEVEVAVRCGFIDAPEIEQRGGCEAREFLTALIGGRKVWIDVLMKMDTGKFVDRHRRIVAVPYLGDRSKTRNIEIEMLLNGWAWVLERYEPDEIYFEALAVAQRNKRGIWAYEDNVHPWTFKRQKYNDRRRPAKETIVEKCPAQGCGGNLIKRNGKFGAFYGCSNYPDCRYSRRV